MPIAKKGLSLRPKANDLALGSKLDQLIVCPHHPNRLRRPASELGDLDADSSVARDSCEVCVIRRIPPVDGEHSGELANFLYRVVATDGDRSALVGTTLIS